MASAVLTLLILIACLALSFVLSGMEAGVFALSRLRVRRLMRAGRPSARVLYRMLENPEDFLWTILVGNTIVNFVILGWIFADLHGRLEQRRLLFATLFILIVFVFYTLFDLLPKMLYRAYPNRLCVFWAKPFRLAHLALRPLVALVEWCSATLLRWTGGKAFTSHLFGNREELRQVMQESALALSSEERTMINRVLDLQSVTVRQITTPIAQAVTVSAQTPVSEVLALARERKVTRLPIWEMRDGQRRIVGLLALNTLLFQTGLDPAKPVAEHVRPAAYLDEDTRLEVALQRMQRSRMRLAVVLGRDRTEVGIISLEDILKFVFGEVKL